MMKKSKTRACPMVEVFDPHKREDFRIPRGKHGDVLFSSLDHGCVVIRMSWMRGWWVRQIPIKLLDSAVVNSVLQETADMGFLSVCPSDSLCRFSGLDEFEVHGYGDALLTHYRHDQRTVAWFLDEASSRGTYEEWLIGSTNQEIDPLDVAEANPRNRSPDLVYFLARFSSMGSVWAFNFDSGEVMAVFRTFDGYEDAVSNIVASLQRSP